MSMYTFYAHVKCYVCMRACMRQPLLRQRYGVTGTASMSVRPLETPLA